MSGIEVWLFRLVFVALVGWFASQMLTRYRLVMAGANNLSLDDVPGRVQRLVTEVVFQSKVIKAKPIVGTAHLFVFWGFCAFGLYTFVGFLQGLGVVDLSRRAWFHAYQAALVPFCLAVLAGIVFLMIRRGIARPAALGATVSRESIMIGFFIVTLMVTFLLEFFVFGHQASPTVAARVNWWVHMVLILLFLGLIPNSKHLHLLVSPLTLFLKSPQLQSVPNLDFEKEEVGFEALKDLPAKARLDAFTCVECGRCQENCPAFATGKLLNPKALILQNEAALLGGKHDTKLVDLYDENVLWQCTTCGACENQCPVGIEHTPVIIGARRGLVSNGEAAEYLTKVYNTLERHQNIWGPGNDSRQKFITSAGIDIFDPAKHEYLVWLGCAGALEADFQRSLRALFDILRAKGVTFGVLARERCTGDVAKRSGNEFLFQELATQNVDDFKAKQVKKIVTSCPHCLKTIGHDYRHFGFEAEVLHSATLVARLTGGAHMAADETVTYHDPCYLGRYAGEHEAPRQLLARFGATVVEPERNRDNPFCCGAGGGLLFEEHEPGKRISEHRYEQLAATGASKVVVGCPFCSIMLKGAAASANANTEFVDLMSYVDGKLKQAGARPDAGA
ncbi:MAG: (Fe-S)-binding protein [Acidobacteria bacterium]|nr:(Fe-S)-binding protein [Acidobacteriota bacterium]